MWILSKHNLGSIQEKQSLTLSFTILSVTESVFLYSSPDFGLVVLCSSENEERAQMVAALEEYKVPGIPRYPKPEELRRYLRDQFTAREGRQGCYHDQQVIWRPAADTIRSGK